MEFLILNVLITIINIAMFGLSLKLYTEYFKDRSASRRQE